MNILWIQYQQTDSMLFVNFACVSELNYWNESFIKEKRALNLNDNTNQTDVVELDISVGVEAFVIGLSQISSFSLCFWAKHSHFPK